MKVEIVTSLVPLQKKQLTLSPQEQTCHAQSKSQFLHFVGVAVLNGEDLCTLSAFQTNGNLCFADLDTFTTDVNMSAGLLAANRRY